VLHVAGQASRRPTDWASRGGPWSVLHVAVRPPGGAWSVLHVAGQASRWGLGGSLQRRRSRAGQHHGRDSLGLPLSHRHEGVGEEHCYRPPARGTKEDTRGRGVAPVDSTGLRWLPRVWNNIPYPGYGIALAYIYIYI
jgi:hypothetical protein